MDVSLKDVIEVVVDVLKISTDDLSENTRFVEDLKADSMDQFLLVDGFSEKFDVSFNDEEAKDIKTIGDVVRMISLK